MKPKVLFWSGIALTITIGGFFLIRPKPTPQKLPFTLCTRLPLVEIPQDTVKFAPNEDRKWPEDQPLTVWFEAGNTPFTQAILKVANEWNDYGAIGFVQVGKMENAKIRVTFKTGGCASAVGRECLSKNYDHKFTMFLEKIDTLGTGDIKFKSIILHEFGHALGIEHELRKATAKIPWNTDAVYDYYYDKYGWSEAKVNKELFDPFLPQNIKHQGFDSTSIMVYEIGPPLTKKPYKISMPNGLSPKDKSGIADWYPK